VKIAIISSRFPFPIDKGDKLRLFHQIKELSSRHQIILISLSDETVGPRARKNLQEYCQKIYVFRLNRMQILFNLFKGLVRGLPAQVAYFFNEGIHGAIQKILLLEKPDHLYCQLIRTAEYGKNHRGFKTLDYMDCFHLSMLKRAVHAGFLMRRVWMEESRRLKKYEIEIYPAFHNHTIISHPDRDAMGLGTGHPLTVIPNGLDPGYSDHTELSEKDIDLLFLGNLGYFSNRLAVRFLLFDLLPLIDDLKSLRITIAGARPGYRLKQWIRQKPGVSLIANPPDTRNIYRRARLFVAPVFAGTGQQNKILEALASGCTVLCTPDVQKALDLPSPGLIRVAVDANDFASQIRTLLSAGPVPDSQISRARAYLQEHFSWEKNASTLEGLFQNT
jgi:glycosyltransferase involved in cell wall biosynthesis